MSKVDKKGKNAPQQNLDIYDPAAQEEQAGNLEL